MHKIDIEKVVSVYSGKRGKCMCGCAGKHTYAKKYQDYGTKDRGYSVGDEDCNDRTVKLIVGKVMRNPDSKFEDNYWYVDTDSRSYVVYMIKE